MKKLFIISLVGLVLLCSCGKKEEGGSSVSTSVDLSVSDIQSPIISGEVDANGFATQTETNGWEHKIPMRDVLFDELRWEPVQSFDGVTRYDFTKDGVVGSVFYSLDEGATLDEYSTEAGLDDLKTYMGSEITTAQDVTDEYIELSYMNGRPENAEKWAYGWYYYKQVDMGVESYAISLSTNTKQENEAKRIFELFKEEYS